MAERGYLSSAGEPTAGPPCPFLEVRATLNHFQVYKGLLNCGGTFETSPIPFLKDLIFTSDPKYTSQTLLPVPLALIHYNLSSALPVPLNPLAQFHFSHANWVFPLFFIVFPLLLYFSLQLKSLCATFLIFAS